MGIAFLVFGGLSHWRGHDTAPYILWALGGGLTVAGLVVPSRLGPVFRGWMRFAHLISKVTTPLFMGLVYFIVITPMGIMRRVFGKSAITHQPNNDSYWVPVEPRPDPAESMRHQF